MMGRHHALLGAVAWCVPASLATHWGAPTLALSTACAGAAATLPDLDEPGSSVAHAFGIVSQAISATMRKVCGGHRQASHSLVGIVVVGALSASALASPMAAAVVVGILMLIGFRVVAPPGLRHGAVVLVVAAASAYAVVNRHLGVSWLPAAVGFGYAAHLIGDMLTTGGVPLLWPSHRRYASPVLGHTGSGRERLLGLVLAGIAILLAVHLLDGAHLLNRG